MIFGCAQQSSSKIGLYSLARKLKFKDPGTIAAEDYDQLQSLEHLVSLEHPGKSILSCPISLQIYEKSTNFTPKQRKSRKNSLTLQ